MAKEEPKTFEEQIYGPDGKLTSEGMKAALASGYGIMHNRTVITHPDGLPTEATLAKGDAQKAATAREHLLAQQKQIAADLALLDAPHEEDTTQRNILAQGLANISDPATQARTGGVGDGDTAGADGDQGDPKSAAAKKKKEEEEAAKKLQAELAKQNGG